MIKTFGACLLLHYLSLTTAFMLGNGASDYVDFSLVVCFPLFRFAFHFAFHPSNDYQVSLIRLRKQEESDKTNCVYWHLKSFYKKLKILPAL